MRQTHTAGERLFVDYAGTTLSVIGGTTGEVVTRSFRTWPHRRPVRRRSHDNGGRLPLWHQPEWPCPKGCKSGKP